MSASPAWWLDTAEEVRAGYAEMAEEFGRKVDLAALTAELDAGRGIPTAAVDTLIAEVRALRDEAQRLREALIQISRWDCLNPPQVALLADLGWLRGVVDRALTP